MVQTDSFGRFHRALWSDFQSRKETSRFVSAMSARISTANPFGAACVGSVLAPIDAGRSPCLAATASRDELRHDRLDAIGGDGEANAIGGRIKLGIDSGERGNTDHVALQV